MPLKEPDQCLDAPCSWSGPSRKNEAKSEVRLALLQESECAAGGLLEQGPLSL